MIVVVVVVVECMSDRAYCESLRLFWIEKLLVGLIAKEYIAASVMKGINLCKRESFIAPRSARLWGNGYVQYELGLSKLFRWRIDFFSGGYSHRHLRYHDMLCWYIRYGAPGTGIP